MGCVVNKNKNDKGSRIKTELDHNVYSLTILVIELMSVDDMVDKVEHASQWKSGEENILSWRKRKIVQHRRWCKLYQEKIKNWKV